MERRYASVPQFDRTTLRRRSAAQLGPFQHRERTIEQCSPPWSTTASAQRHGARASAQVAYRTFHSRQE
jgi:hypothetical protein